MLTTSITLHRKPKDGSSVTIISKSVTYQISASGTEAPTGTWSENVVATTDTKPYLWTRTIVVYSDKNSTTSYSVSYRGKDGSSAVTYEIQLDTDSVVLKSDTKQFETHKLGDVHFMYHQGSYMEDMTKRIIDTYSYIILYYGYEAKKDENGKPVLGSDGKPVMEYKAISYSSNEGITDIWNTMQMNVGDDAECYGMKYIWYDKNLPDNDEAMFEKIWSELDGIPPKELGIKILSTKMFTVRREADSIQSSDVLFAVGDNKTTAPTTGWITNFSGLTLADGKYVWTCTKTTLTNGTSYYTGAYCLGECYDFAHVDELYALGSSATKSPDIDSSLGVNIWQSSYTPKKGMYLWTCVRVTYNSNNIPYYLNKKCVSYFPTDGTNGTSFTPKGMADGYYSKATEIPVYSDEQNGKIYLVDDATNVTSPFIVPDAPYVVQYVLHNGEYVLFLVHAEFGDGYNVNGHLYVANDDKWVDFGEIQGAKGDQGEPGKDAVNINLSPSELVYNADKDGNISSTQFNNNTSKVSATRGGKAVSFTVSIVSKDNCEADFISSDVIKITKITTESVATGKYVPASAGGVKLKVTVDGTDYYSYLPFRVNTNTFVKTVLETDESFQRKYTEISNKYNTVSNELNGKASKDELREVSSSIEQTARRISLEVSSNAVGRRNLLVNSDFHNQESLYFSSGTRIECTTGKDGINCVHITSSSVNGVYWDGTKSGGMSVVITKGKKYTFSCWVKSSSTSAQFRIRAYSTSDIANASITTGFYEADDMHVSSPNTWELFTFTIDTSSAVTNYLAVIFCVTGASDAYICKPMMEEGDTYKGWSRSQQDYDYVGGNMIDNARTLEVGGSLKSLNPNGLPDYERAYYGDCMALRIKNTNANNTYLVMEFATGSMELDVDYIFSFLAKGKANIGLYAQCDINAEGDYVFSEDSVNQGTRLLNVRYASIIEIPNQLTTQYKRYWGHMRFHGHLPSKLYIQLNGAGEVYVCQPKLEKGATMTEFTERKTDLVDKASLKKAGIGITDSEVLLYGEQVKVMNGNAIAALFKNGMLNADLIAAKVLESLGSNGARVSISDGIMEFFGSVNKTKPNIRFGLNSEGSAVLSYYDNNGDLLYDLGPDGISTMDKTNGSFTAYQFYTSQNLFGVSSTPSSYGTYKTFTSSHNPPSISETFLVADNSYDSHLFPSLNPSTNTKTTLYRYKAPRINGKIVADSLNGFTTQELASKADGKYFTSKAKADVVKDGKLASLAPDGDYWNVNAGVVNQGNFMPAVLKLGEYYDKPTYSRALPMSLIAGSKELGIVGKICSKETTRQWGQGIQG